MTRTQSQPDFFHNLSLLVTGSLATAGLALGLGLWRGGDRFWNVVQAIIEPPPAATQVDVQSLVVQQVRGMSELTTATFTMQAVVPTRRDRTFAGQVIGSTTLLYIGYGEVRAGIDLDQIEPSDVQQMGDTLQIRLPPPRIQDSKIDVNRSSVYDYDRGFLGLGPDVAPDLQQAAQQETLQKIVQTACEQGILQTASDRASLTLRQFLSTTGYTNVQIEVQPPTPNACSQAVP